MDRFSQESDDVKARLTGSSGLLLSRVSSAPEPRPDGAFLPPFDMTARKRDSPMDRPYQRSATELSSPSTRHFWPSAGSSPYNDSKELPDKRTRLEYIPERNEGEAPISKRRMDPYIQANQYVDPREHPPSDQRQEGQGLFSGTSLSTCFNCSNTETLIRHVVRSLLELEVGLSLALSIPRANKAPPEDIELEVTKLSLKESLAWTIEEMRDTTRLLHRNTTTKPELPPLADVVPTPFVTDIRRLSIHAQSPAVSSTIKEHGRTPISPDLARVEASHPRAQEPPPDSTPRPFDHSLPPILLPDEMKRSQNQEQMLSSLGQSPHPSSASSFFGSAQSPMHSQPSSRTLPSPPGAPFARIAGSGLAQYSPTTSPSAHHTHLQDLQHQISTKTLALQTLQREHDQLLAAFSRSQIRCTALDKKSQVSDHEINTLSEDKIRLEQQVESLEGQVQELVKSRDAVHQQSSADGAQWRQIMAMSSQLQIKGADDARRFKDARETWEAERESLRRRIDELESGKEMQPETRTVSGSTTPVANDSILTSDSVEALRAEVIRLRRRCTELELMLQELAGEAQQIEHAITAMERVRRNLTGKKRPADDS